MFNENLEISELNKFCEGNMMGTLGIEFLAINSDSIVARMPVDHRTKQPMGLLHGGASVALAESLGSVASNVLLTDPKTQAAVGLEINANHIKSVKEGWVIGTVKPLHVGKRTHLWKINIKDEAGNLVCVSRLTVMIIDRK